MFNKTIEKEITNLIDKALEIQQLRWWLSNPTVKSFFLRSEATGDDNGKYFVETENRSYRLTTDAAVLDDELDPDDEYEMNSNIFDSYMHPDFSTSSYYPVDINQSYYARVYRPYPTDAEIEKRINHFLYTLTFDGTP